MISSEMSDRAILKELGLRISRYRLNRNMTQSALAIESGISRATVQRVERGASIQLSKLVRILRVLNLITNMDSFVPEPPVSPLQQLEMRGKTRQRAPSLEKDDNETGWSWGDTQ